MIKSICFSGHRLNKIKLIISKKSSNVEFESNFFEVIKSILYIKINCYIDIGFKRFYIGMSDGIDLWVGEILLELKLNQYPDIQIVAVRPFEKHGNRFSIEDKNIYSQILKVADKVVCLRYENSKGAYFERNRYMVDNSSKLLALVSDYESGTGYTIKYAKSSNKSIDIINLNSLANGLLKAMHENRIFYDMMDCI